MGTIDIFTNNLYFSLTAISLFLFFIVMAYSSFEVKYSDSIWLVFWGLLFEFFGSWLGYKIADYYTQPNFAFWVLGELLLLLTSMTLMALGSVSMLGKGQKGIKGFVWGITTIALVAIGYFLFISPSGEMISSMRLAFPFAGFLFITSAFWSHARYGFGFKAAGLVTSVVSMLILARLIGFEEYTQELWYIPTAVYVLLAISVLLIRSDSLVYSLEESKQKIQSHTNQIENIIKSSPFPIIISRLSDDKILEANNNAMKLFGIKAGEFERYKLKDFFLDQENRKALNELLEKEKEVRDFEILVKTATGNTPFWLLTSANVIDYNYDITIYLAFQDITSRKNRENILKNQAIRDPLTSLYNRRYFEEEVKTKSAISGPPFSILMLDVDKFKNVNDTYGHKVGDQVLIEMAQICEKALRGNDIVARYGGEEFVIYLHNTDEDKSKIVAERLRETIAANKVDIGDGMSISVTVSIGIATSHVSTHIDTMVKMADAALYTAKNNGRNRSEVFDKNNMDVLSKEEAPKKSSLHPMFAKEEDQEISLIDGIEAEHIIDGSVKEEE